MTKARKTAVVFAYHNVGVRCLKVLASLGHTLGLDILAVFTHPDNPNETIWWDRVADVAMDYDLPVELIGSGDEAEQATLINRLQTLQPDFIFSFYYRFMLPVAALEAARDGAFNMHGSLLPKYRGRVPVNWAIIHGETQTGATLHRMTVKPDAGALLGQQAVPILPDDTAKDVFDKVTVAAECVLVNALPALMSGTIVDQPNPLSEGSYFTGRKPADGLIDCAQSGQAIYNLVRAVAPPYYPGAFVRMGDRSIVVHKLKWRHDMPVARPAGLCVVDGIASLIAGDGTVLQIVRASVGEQIISNQTLAHWIEHA